MMFTLREIFSGHSDAFFVDVSVKYTNKRIMFTFFFLSFTLQSHHMSGAESTHQLARGLKRDLRVLLST